jgi:hypothetical protein
MRKLVSMCLALLMLLPMGLAYVTPPTTIGIVVGTEPFEPVVWRCGAWVMADDPAETGRVSNAGQELIERTQSYIFAGEQLSVDVLVLDKNGIEKVGDIYLTVDGVKEANCAQVSVLGATEQIRSNCNARLGEEIFTVPPAANTMAYYRCILTAEPASSMHGSKPVTVKVTDESGKSATAKETLNYFFNPAISLTVDGAINFGNNVRPGTQATSPTVVVKSNSEGGVILDMFIAGKDFYDSSSSGAKCPSSNVLSLSSFSYYAVNGAYSTAADPRATNGYVPINYCIGAECGFTRGFYNTREIMQVQPVGPYFAANELVNGAGISMTFKLSLPAPCNGNFNTGGFYLLGEAI